MFKLTEQYKKVSRALVYTLHGRFSSWAVNCRVVKSAQKNPSEFEPYLNISSNYMIRGVFNLVYIRFTSVRDRIMYTYWY